MSEYTPLSSEEKESVDDFEAQLREENRNALDRRRSRLRTCLSRWPWIVHFLFYAGYLMLVLAPKESKPELCLHGREQIYNDPPIEYESVVFKRAGFHDKDHNIMTPWEGRPDIENEAAWNRLTSVGVVSLTEDEMKRIPGGTAPNGHNASEYIVEIEMFHQLHCLRALRTQLWEFEDGTLSKRGETQRQQHFDHCIDYLRQAVMCHGDLTPNTFEYNSELNVYLAHHATVHQCRSFDKIWEWAKVRNTNGMSVEGKHKNIEGAAKEE